MTNKQREAIELAREFTKIDFNNPIGWTGYYDTELKELSQTIETVLSLIKAQDKEIEHWKNGFERELEDNRKNTCELLKQDLVIRKKDKQIELMAKTISNNIVITYFNDTENVKRYYEKLVERKFEDVKD